MLNPSLLQQLQILQQQSKKITLVTGVFDLLHQEHQLFLRKAAALGDLLVIGVESDARVRQMKGADRPWHDQDQRVANLQQLGIASLVFLLPEDFSKPADHEELILAIRPAFLAVSSHTAHLLEKQEILTKYGGEVKIVHQHNPAISTTSLLKSSILNKKII